jgi:hypothetical protein
VRQHRGCGERERGARDEERPGGRPHRPQHHDHEEDRDVEEMREGRHGFAAGFLQRRRDVAQ